MSNEIEIGSSIGHYRIISKIGAGGMGEVYKAHDSRLDRNVAVRRPLSERIRPPRHSPDEPLRLR